MSKKNQYLLHTVLMLLIIIVAIGGMYYFFHKQIINYYDGATGDIFSYSMKNENIFTFEDGSSIVSGTFLQNDDTYENESLFIKSYDKKGNLNDIGSKELPSGYTLEDFCVTQNHVYLLYTYESKDTGKAIIYGFNSKGKITCENTIDFTDYPGKTKKFYIAAIEDDYMYTISVNSQLLVFNSNNESIIDLSAIPDVRITDFVYFNKHYIITGSLDENSLTHAYYCIYANDGTQVSSVSTMTEFVSTAKDITYNPDEEAFFITGYYFDEKAYTSQIKASGEKISSDNIKDKAKYSINRALNSDSRVLISSQYSKDPWASLFILKVDFKGEIINSLSPIDSTSSNGISSLKLVNTSYSSTKDSENASIPILTLISSVALNENATEYTTDVYTVYSDFSEAAAVDISISSDTCISAVSDSNGQLTVYTGINGKNAFELHCCEDIVSFAKTQRSILLGKKTIHFIEKSLNILPLVFVYLILITTLRYSIYAYYEKIRRK